MPGGTSVQKDTEKPDDFDSENNEQPVDKTVETENQSDGSAKPEQVPARDESDKEYYEEHKGLPTHEDRPAEEVQAEEAETLAERAEAKKTIDAEKAELGTLSTAAQAAAVQTQKSQQQIQIEEVLQEGLADQFQAMSPGQQQAFKSAGEQTASKIAELMKSTKVQVNKVLELIKKWLGMIPGVNKYFLDQESKIKTDKLLRIKHEQAEGAIME